MRKIPAVLITEKVKSLCVEANCRLGKDLLDAVRRSQRREKNHRAGRVLQQILENAVLARQENRPACQDTGYAVVWVELGQDIHVTGGSLEAAIHKGVRAGYGQGYLRKSIVSDPLVRENTGDNTPAVIHYQVVKGSRLKITLEVKGGGSENLSRSAMLKPTDGPDVIRDTVVTWVREAGAKPCPPVIVGIGIGGDFEECARIAKQALLRPVGKRHPDPRYAKMEKEILQAVNRLGIGPQGLGGMTTALDVHIETRPCHIACLPLAMNLDCHSHRVKRGRSTDYRYPVCGPGPGP
jgi:fumarate hydratase subunit alpha